MGKKKISERDASNLINENVDKDLYVFEISNSTDLSSMSREVKKDLNKGTVKLIRIISWE